jgi:hypothetical protein
LISHDLNLASVADDVMSLDGRSGMVGHEGYAPGDVGRAGADLTLSSARP